MAFIDEYFGHYGGSGAGSSEIINGNYIINGSFDVWQRGNGFGSVITAGYYAADRFFIDPAGATCDLYRQTFPAGQTDVEGNPESYLRYSIITPSTGNSILVQRIENVNTLSGGYATLSFYAKASSGINVYTDFGQYFGSGGSAYVDGNVQVVEHNLSTTWRRYTATFNIPSVTGKTIGPSSYLLIRFYFPNNAAVDIDFANIKLENGIFTTDFIKRNIVYERILCHRYYCQSNEDVRGGGTIGTVGGIAHTASLMVANFVYPTVMRIAPSVTIINNFAHNKVRDAVTGSQVTINTPNLIGATRNGFAGIQDVSGTPFTAGRGYDFDIIADAEL